jgi:anti-anti-sigma regulatory factor
MSHFSLPADCTVGQSAALKAALQSLMTSNETTVVVSAAEVERCDASMLQLIAALKRSLSNANRALDVRDPSQALVEAASQLGLSHLILGGVRS